jgi:hypothetical protein
MATPTDPDIFMVCTRMLVIATRGYERGAARLLTPGARVVVEAEIVARPDAWPVIAGTGGARKARIALPGRGKRGGARVIYFVLTARGALYLLDIYAKNAKDDLTSADKQGIRRRIEAIAAEAQRSRAPADRRAGARDCVVARRD